jgi:hypothetical protein
MLDSLDTLIAFVVIMLVVSLLITIAVQIIAAALNLRGLNVLKGLAHTLNTVHPGFEDRARSFADRIISGRLLSDSSASWLPRFWRRASAVRPAEVFDAIHRIAIGRRDVPGDLRGDAQNLLIALGFDGTVLDAAAKEISAATETAQNLADAAKEAVKDVPEKNLSQVENTISALENQIQAYAVAGAARLAQTGMAAAQTVDTAYKQFAYWFEISQERAQQWFTIHTRICTVIFAIFFAFWLQLDTVEIFKLVSTNRAVRDKLVAEATAVANQAEKILGESKSVLQTALETWRNGLKDESAKQAVLSINASPNDTRGGLRQTLEQALGQAHLAGSDDLLVQFDKAVDDSAAKNLETKAQQYNALKPDLAKTGFDLFPTDSKGRWGHGWCGDLGNHFLGMIFSAGLLSLGAPFWYNALKSLTSLRSTVAQNISNEQKQEQKKSGGDQPAPPPPTV